MLPKTSSIQNQLSNSKLPQPETSNVPTSGLYDGDKNEFSSSDIKDSLKRRSQVFFFILLVSGLYLPMRTLYELQSIRHWMQSSFETPPSGWTSVSDLYLALVSFCVLFVLKKIIVSCVYRFIYDKCKEKENEEVRVQKSIKASYAFFKAIYFIFASIVGYYIIRDEPYLSHHLLGKGSFD
jgi:hypothetical protein